MTTSGSTAQIWLIGRLVSGIDGKGTLWSQLELLTADTVVRD